jgi:hypothetical protein
LQDLSEGERGKLQRAMGLKMEQLKVISMQRVGVMSWLGCAMCHLTPASGGRRSWRSWTTCTPDILSAWCTTTMGRVEELLQEHWSAVLCNKAILALISEASSRLRQGPHRALRKHKQLFLLSQQESLCARQATAPHDV